MGVLLEVAPYSVRASHFSMRSGEANRLDVMLRMQLAHFPARDHLCVIGLDAEVAHVRTRRTVECASEGRACFAYESKLTEVLHPSSVQRVYRPGFSV